MDLQICLPRESEVDASSWRFQNEGQVPESRLGNWDEV